MMPSTHQRLVCIPRTQSSPLSLRFSRISHLNVQEMLPTINPRKPVYTWIADDKCTINLLRLALFLLLSFCCLEMGELLLGASSVEHLPCLVWKSAAKASSCLCEGWAGAHPYHLEQMLQEIQSVPAEKNVAPWNQLLQPGHYRWLTEFALIV